jgi:hypothetical protein
MQWILEIPDDEVARLSRVEGIPSKHVGKMVVRKVAEALAFLREGTLTPIEGVVPLTEEEADAAIAARAADLVAEAEQELGG